MKMNMPVTDREVMMKDGSILVTRTDTKGRITYANDDFVEISGFSREELVGKNHNIVRHPDMPPEAFEDLWNTNKQAKPWKGLVKNRTKAGDYYWVEANVTPVFKKGQIVEYLSVRYAPSREQINTAESLYQQVQVKKATLRPTGMAAKLKIIKEMPLHFKATLAMLAFLIPDGFLMFHLYQQQSFTLLSVVALLTVIGIMLGVHLLKLINSSLEEAIRIFYRLADEKFRNPIDIDRNDLIGDFFRGLQSMQVKLNSDMSYVKEMSVVSGRLKQALDNVESNVMVANNNYEIIYMNKTVQKMFSEAEADIQNQLPDFKADQLLGSNIDIFHKNPAHQRAMLDKLTGTFRSALMIGGHTMNIVASPVIDEHGERIGIVVEWKDRTEEVNIEREIQTLVEGVKTGELSSRINMADKDGFYEVLSRNLNEVAETVEKVMNEIAYVMSGLANGNLTRTVNSQYYGLYETCKNDINTSLAKLSEVFGQIKESSEFIRNSSQEIASGNNNLSHRAEEQAASLEQTASSMEELTSTVKNNSDNAQQADKLANSARTLAEDGGEVVKRAVNAMEEINESSNKIAEIIGVIDEIAFQTNLLALNASVEAARAGEQGRGFSVVATEVRNLAQRSATAAQESKDLIQTSIQRVRTGTEFVNETGSSLNEIVTGVKKVGDIVSEIAAASAEQSQGIEQVNQAVSQMDEITQQNAALAEEASAASVSMSEQCDSMAGFLSFFEGGGSGSSGSIPSSTGQAASSLDFSLAKSKHLSWKSKLRNFLEGSESLTMDQAVSHRDCDLGKWLYSTGMTSYGHLPAMQQIEPLHKQMHELVHQCISHRQNGNAAGAEQAYQQVAGLSDKIVSLLSEVEASISGKTAVSSPKPVVKSAPTTRSAPSVSVSSGGDDEWEEF